MNFLKGSLFRRNTEPEELEPMEESGGGILAVWGSPGCGKTVLLHNAFLLTVSELLSAIRLPAQWLPQVLLTYCPK